MITPREMSQLFYTITSMHTLCVGDADFVDKMAVINIIAGYCDENPNITSKRIGEGKTEWRLSWPIPLTDVVEESEPEEEGEEGTPV